LAGAATGALLGVLFAPAKGTVTRRTIVRKGERQVDDLKDKFNDLVDAVADKFDSLKGDVEEMAERSGYKERSFKNEVI
jgi:gas vesicle protein